MEYSHIINQIKYWKSYKGTGDKYRIEHDRDCILTGGNLFADTIISLWLPLRYTLNHYNCENWMIWKEKSSRNKINLKKTEEFMDDLINNIEIYLPKGLETELLSELFEKGVKRQNVMILPYRQWNVLRGKAPYWDYFPHFLYDLLDTENRNFIESVQSWIRDEHIEMFFHKSITKEELKDLWGSGNVLSHSPRSMNISLLLQNYINILKERENYFKD